MGPENGEEDHDQKDKAHRPADAGQERGIAALMLGNVHRARDIVRIVICHGEEAPR
jgi:hypothetical protein